MARKNFDEEMFVSEALDRLRAHPLAATRAPLLVRVVENPNYTFFGRNLFLFPGAMEIQDHDVVHVLLDRGFEPHDEAYVIGFTMGSSRKLSKFARRLYLWIARNFYPDRYRFRETDLAWFVAGVKHATLFSQDDFSTIRAEDYLECSLRDLRAKFLVTSYIESHLRYH